jgi:hypothetical protein
MEPDEPTQPVAENRRVEIVVVPPAIGNLEEILEGFQR